MSIFPETIAASLAGSKVTCAFLVWFDFATTPMRLWRGAGPLHTNEDNVWLGIGNLGSIKGVEQAVNGQAPEMTFTMSGADSTVVQLAREEFLTEAKGRLAYVLIQFFGVDDPADPDNQRPLDNPFPLACGRMLQPSFVLSNDGAWSVTISAESLFSLRSRPRAALWTDADQQHRFLGDEGFQFVGALVNKIVSWPDY